MLLLPIETMICLYERTLVVMLSLSLEVLELWTILWISSSFLSDNLGKFSFNLRMSWMLVDKAYAQVQAGLGEELLDLSLIGLLFDFSFAPPSLCNLDEFVSRGILMNSTGLEGGNLSDFLFVGVLRTLMVNSSFILSWNNLKPSPTSKLSHPPL